MRLLAGRIPGAPALLSANCYLTQRCNLRRVYCSAPLRGTGEHDHRCPACFTVCTVEQNSIFSLRPGPLPHFARRHLGRLA